MRKVFATALLAIVAWGLVWLAGCEKPARPEPAVQAKPAVVAKADTAAGQAVYDQHCTKCHRAGTYDKEGRAPDLTRHAEAISPSFVAHHHGNALSQDDVDSLKAFLSAQR